MTNLTCPHCRGDAGLDVIAEAMGRNGNARVRISDLSVLRCTYCGKCAPRYGEFITDLARVLNHLHGLPVPKSVGLFKKQPACAECKTLLDNSKTEPCTFEEDVELAGPPFHIDLSVLATVCTGCGTRQCPVSEVPLEAEIAEAVKRALSSVAVEAVPL